MKINFPTKKKFIFLSKFNILFIFYQNNININREFNNLNTDTFLTKIKRFFYKTIIFRKKS